MSARAKIVRCWTACATLEIAVPRLFVAIDFPTELKQSLAALRTDIPGVRWVAPGNLHLTLRFIGEVDEPTAARIGAALGDVRADAFQLALAGVGHFHGHTLWVGIEPSPALTSLQAAVESALRGIGLAPDERPFAPHVKLAGSQRRRGFRRFRDEHAGLRARPFEVTRFSLIESRLGGAGAVYERRADYPLRPSETDGPPSSGAGRT